MAQVERSAPSVEERPLRGRDALLAGDLIGAHTFERVYARGFLVLIVLAGSGIWMTPSILCCRSTILSVGNCSGKMSVYGRTDIEYERAEPVTYLERSIRAALDDEGGGPAAWSK